MVLHGLADDVRDLGIAAVIHPVHRVEHAALHRLQSVHDMRYRPLEDYVGGIVQEPVLEHSGELVLPAVAPEKSRKAAFVLTFGFYQFFRTLFFG